jgi:hypothetical protein
MIHGSIQIKFAGFHNVLSVAGRPVGLNHLTRLTSRENFIEDAMHVKLLNGLKRINATLVKRWPFRDLTVDGRII